MAGYDMRGHLLERIHGEYQAYRAGILGLANAEIFARCYEIDTMVSLYEILIEKIQGLPDETLEALMQHRGILNGLYASWLKKDDSSYRELEQHVEEETGAVRKKQEEIKNGK